MTDIQKRIGDITGVRTNYDRFMEQYELDHKYCPKCGSVEYNSTLLARVFNLNDPNQFEDPNELTCCGCKYKHKMKDRVKTLNTKEE